MFQTIGWLVVSSGNLPVHLVTILNPLIILIKIFKLETSGPSGRDPILKDLKTSPKNPLRIRINLLNLLSSSRNVPDPTGAFE